MVKTCTAAAAAAYDQIFHCGIKIHCDGTS
jgi:hypothetical protein